MSRQRIRQKFGLGITLLSLAVLSDRAHAGELTVIASFDGINATSPTSGVVLDARGNLFGSAGGGSNNAGTIFEIPKGSGSMTYLASLTGTPGAPPNGIVLDGQANIYGTTQEGGASGNGSVFELAKGSTTITNLASFDGTNGSLPAAILTMDAHGNLYGTTAFGGATDFGTVFAVGKGTNTITPLASFTSFYGGSSIINEYSSVTLDTRGNIFGTSGFGGTSNNGTIWEIAQGSHTITTVASFDGTNGSHPLAGLTSDSSGNLYGSTSAGGAHGDGTLFEIAQGSNTITTLASFDGANGVHPSANLALDSQGNLYGTTSGGGASGDGTVFELIKGATTINFLASFDGADGSNPYSGVAMDANGILYGTTFSGGANGAGTVWEFTAGAVPEPSSLIMGLISISLVAGFAVMKPAAPKSGRAGWGPESNGSGL
jgi:uncharacterized repeat protein (TIGR03803 family)